MKKNLGTATNTPYLHFLNLLKSWEHLPSWIQLDSIESQLLNHVSLKSQAGQPPLVSDLMNLDKIGSPATLHNRIKMLRKKGLIEFSYVEDGRKKYIKPTSQAEIYFANMSDLMMRAARSA